MCQLGARIHVLKKQYAKVGIWKYLPPVWCEAKNFGITFSIKKTNVLILSGEIGSGGWDRTNDQLINSQLLYRWATPEHKTRDALNFTLIQAKIF